MFQLTPEAAQEIRKYNTQDRQRARDLKDLVRTPGWAAYMKLLDGYIDDRMKDVLAPTPSNGALTSEYVKGTVNGLITARNVVPTIVADYEAFSQSGEDTEEEDSGKGPEHPAPAPAPKGNVP